MASGSQDWCCVSGITVYKDDQHNLNRLDRGQDVVCVMMLLV